MQGAGEPDGGSTGPKTVSTATPTHPRSVTLEDAATGGAATPVGNEPPAGEPMVIEPARYQILGEYAQGGLGRILKARDRHLDRIVALKELRRDHPVARNRFAREVRVTAKLQHPNIVPLHEAGTWPTGAAFYSMKLVEGRTLAQAITDARGPEERYALLPALIDVADAIAYAHAQGIIHRDLKPANVLVGPFGETVVIDWGLAKQLNGDDEAEAEATYVPTGDAFETRVGAIVGTPAYMPPEQAAGAPVDERADVFALGAMLYHVISGVSPYADYEQESVLDAVLSAPPRRLTELAPEAPPDLVAIVEKAMARHPDDRYRTAREMADELRRFSNGRLVGAYKYTPWDLLARFFKRYRAAVITGALALLALAAFSALSVARITEERDRAERSASAEASARHVAEQRVDELLVEKARSLLDRDPTRAIAWLKRLDSIPLGAATVAARAEDRGVATDIIRGHFDLINSVAISPDGSFIVSGGADKRVRLWNTATRRSIEMDGHTERVTSVAVSPDGRRIASASYDNTIVIWNRDGSRSSVLSGHRGPVKAVSFSPDGKTIGTVSGDGTVRLWSAADGAARILEAPADRELFGDFSADGRWFLSGSHAGSVRLWALGSEERRVLDGHVGAVNAAALSKDASVVVTGGEDATVRLWSGGAKRARVVPVENPVGAVALSPNARTVAVGDRAGRVLSIDVESGRVDRISEHGERVSALAFSADGRYLASAGWDKAVRLVDRKTRTEQLLAGHGDVVSSIAFSRDGRLLASASWDKTVRTWSLPIPDASRAFRGHEVGVRSVAFSPDGRFLASGGHDNAVRIWSLEDGSSRVFLGHTDHVYRVVFSPDGKQVASSSDDQTVRMWNTDTGKARVFSGHRADVEELAFSPDGRRLASASEDHTARIWSTTGSTVAVLAHDNDVTALSFAPGGVTLASASRDRLVRVWSARTGRLLKTLDAHQDEVWALAHSPDGTTIASAGSNGKIVFWEPATGQHTELTGVPGARVLAFSRDGSRIAVAGVAPRLWVCAVTGGPCDELRGHQGIVRDLAFAAEADTLVTASGDGTVQVWDLLTRERRVLEGHAAPIFDLDVSPDGRSVATASSDAIVRLWPIRVPPSPVGLRAFLDRLSTEEISGDLPGVSED